MAIYLRAKSKKFAIWQAPSSGDPMAPFDDPVKYWDLIRVHSDLFYYAVALNKQVTVDHAKVSGKSPSKIDGADLVLMAGQRVTKSINLVKHGLGYVPKFMVAYNGDILPPSYIAQAYSDGRGRFLTAYATTSYIVLFDVGVSSKDDLPAASRTYQVVVFRDAAAVDGAPAMQIKSGRARLAFGKIDSDETHLRRAGSGDSSPFAIALDRTSDLKNGRVRTVLPGGATISEPGYNGSFKGSTSLKVKA